MTRRELLALIGTAAGSAVMYQAMTSLGHAEASPYRGPPVLGGDVKGASVVIVGAGLAGMVAAHELRKAGYKVQVLEYSARAGGRCWSIRGGDRYVELGGFAQSCTFAKGHYFNPGPWRIPFHHYALVDYCKRFKVALEPFVQVNYNAYIHAQHAFGGKPQRYRAIDADFRGGIAELLAKAVDQQKLDGEVGADEKEMLLGALKAWGALENDYTYRQGELSSGRRGYEKEPGGGLSAEPEFSAPMTLDDILKARAWQALIAGSNYEFQTTMFQPVGGMDMIAKAFQREVGDLIRFDARVTAIRQSETGVTVAYEDTRNHATMQAEADWCIAAVPLSILDQIELSVGAPMKAAIAAVPFVPAVKIGLEMKRRFWEEDEAIYGGITNTDLPIRNIGYPCTGYNGTDGGVLLGTYAIFNTYAYEFGALPPEERIARALEWGAQIHPQYKDEYKSGMAIAWQRNPATLGCFANWSDEARKAHYRNLCALDGRIMLAGEHASYLPAWQEGAVLSALDAVQRLHQRVVAG